MLSIAKISAESAGALTQYFESHAGRENYYEEGGEPPGRWAGEGAAAMGLVGIVEDGELGKIMQGYHPKTDAALVGNAGEKHAPGWDCTFSAPKSVSAVWAVAERADQIDIQTAHGQAVAYALGYLEREAVAARRGKDGLQREQTAGVIAAVYEHSTSRNMDPQLHTHCLVFNVAQRQDGSMGGVDLDTRHKMAAGALYRVALAENLRERGYSIERDGDSFKLVGTPDRLVEQWSSRRAEIVGALKEAGLNGAKAAQAATLETRENKTGIDRKDLFQRWQAEAAGHEFGPEQVKALRAEYGAERLPLPDTSAILSDLTDRNSAFSDLQALHRTAVAAQGAMAAGEAEAYVANVLASEEVVALKKHIDEGVVKMACSTREMVELEKNMAATAAGMKLNTSHQVPAETVRVAIDGKGLSEQQQHAVEHITRDTGAVACVQGWAGTGKSYMLASAREAWQADGYAVFGAALSGKAAEGLETGSGIPSQTLHSMLRDIEQGKLPLHDRIVLVIDEAGMVGSRQMAELVQRCNAADAKLVLVGDAKQLQPVEAGGAFKAVADKVGQVELTDVRRQNHEADKEMARAFREGRAGDALKNLDERDRLHVESTQRQAQAGAVEAWVKDIEAGKNSTLLAASRNEVDDLNLLARQVARDAGMLKSEDKVIETARGEIALAEGDRVVFTRNSAFLDVKNGMVGQVMEVTDKTVRVKTGDREITVQHQGHDQAYKNLDYAYAMTTHKSQGATLDTAHIVAGEMTAREWSYVAATRAREATHVHTSQALLDRENIGKSDLARDMSRSQEKDTTLVYEERHQKHDHDDAKDRGGEHVAGDYGR